jgi:hypothetical protein
MSMAIMAIYKGISIIHHYWGISSEDVRPCVVFHYIPLLTFGESPLKISDHGFASGAA